MLVTTLFLSYRMDKANKVQPYSGIVFSHKKEESADPCYSMAES